MQVVDQYPRMSEGKGGPRPYLHEMYFFSAPLEQPSVLAVPSQDFPFKTSE
eukprot:c51403_g1_i1 orf=2-151(-)